MVKEIPLTQGQSTLVNGKNYDNLSKDKWYAGYNKHTKSYYAKRYSRKKDGTGSTEYMARRIMNAKKGDFVDHRNHDTLNNREENLRICTRTQNMHSIKHHKDTFASQYKGVTEYKVGEKRKKWRVQLRINGKLIHLGLFESEIDAAKVYDKKAKELFGEFKCLNFPEDAV